MSYFSKIFSSFIILVLVSNCGGLSKTNTREVPVNAQERARKNIEEGRGVSLEVFLKIEVQISNLVHQIPCGERL